MSHQHSEALRRRWQNAAYREKQTEANRVASALTVGVPRVKRTKGKRMSEEIAQAAGNLATVEALWEKVQEWEDCYDRLDGAFDLHMAICECQNALADYAGGYYDVALGALAARVERAEAELEAARAMVKVVHWAVENHYAPPPLCDALAAYDQARKANEHAEP